MSSSQRRSSSVHVRSTTVHVVRSSSVHLKSSSLHLKSSSVHARSTSHSRRSGLTRRLSSPVILQTQKEECGYDSMFSDDEVLASLAPYDSFRRFGSEHRRISCETSSTALTGSSHSSVTPIRPGSYRFRDDPCEVPPVSKRRVFKKTASMDMQMVADDNPYSSSNRTSNARRRCVSFGTVEIRYYRRILSDNPSCRTGPGLGIGWDYRRGGTLEVDDWERKRQRRPESKLLLSREHREYLLTQAGYTHEDMAKMVRHVGQVRHKRKQTIINVDTSILVSKILDKGLKSLGKK